MGGIIASSIRFLKLCGFGDLRCANCLAPFFPEENDLPTNSLCPDCQQKLRPFAGIKCRYCGIPVLPAEKDEFGFHQCGRCSQDPPLWNGLCYHGLYEGELRDLVLRLKFDGELQIAKLFADFLIQASSCLPKADLAAPVPQFPAHLRKRGYNQANEIGKAFSKKAGLPYFATLLERVKPGSPQESLTALQRRENLKNAFHCRHNLKDLKVWLVDDVLTTGSTCREAAMALRRAGAREVHILVIARTDR